MTKVKTVLLLLISLLVIIALALNFNVIAEKIKDIVTVTPDLVILPSNEYKKTEEFKLISESRDYVPNDYQDLLDIFYSTLNNGWDDFTFYCPVEYSDCLTDVEKISLDEDLLSHINNYVDPYNSYTSIKTLYDESGKVEIKIKHLYSDEEIKEANEYIDNLFNTYIKDGMSDTTKIEILHDYIINNTKYDKERANEGNSNYDSARIMGIINEHYGICSGYADLMAVILDKLDIPNFKVASESHVWNVVYVDGNWLHLDLTWDDPITYNGRDVLDHSYFLINNQKLKELSKDTDDHDFDVSFYPELNY